MTYEQFMVKNIPQVVKSGVVLSYPNFESFLTDGKTIARLSWIAIKVGGETFKSVFEVYEAVHPGLAQNIIKDYIESLEEKHCEIEIVI